MRVRASIHLGARALEMASTSTLAPHVVTHRSADVSGTVRDSIFEYRMKILVQRQGQHQHQFILQYEVHRHPWAVQCSQRLNPSNPCP